MQWPTPPDDVEFAVIEWDFPNGLQADNSDELSRQIHQVILSFTPLVVSFSISSSIPPNNLK